jgi:hypothetical protein
MSLDDISFEMWLTEHRIEMVRRFLNFHQFGLFAHTEDVSNEIVKALGCSFRRTSPYTVIYYAKKSSSHEPKDQSSSS